MLALLAVLSLFITQCSPAAPTAGPTEAAPTQPAVEATSPPEATTAPEGGDYTQAAREETVIFDIDGGRVADPENWNPYLPTGRRDHGFHQVVMEPLFILNYETGEIEPWLGESMTANDALDVWTLQIRDGIRWSDGEAFNADDVVFSIQLLIDNAPTLNDSAAMKDWVASVTKVDELTVEFQLTRPNPRFQLDYFSVRIWGGVNIVPEHIWNGQDPESFTYYDPAQGWPVFTGPYRLASASDTEFSYVRDDNWWGAASGFQSLPQPKKLVWVWYGPEETRAAAMADNQLDSLMDITLGALQALQARNPNVIAHFSEPPYAWVPDPCSRTFELNHTVEPWGSKEMRWALNYAIDREQIVAIAYEGSTFASRHFFPAYPPLDRFVDLAVDAGLYDTFPLMTHDPDQAKELIEGQGYTLVGDYYEKDGQQLTLDIATHEAFIEKQRIAQVLVEQFQAIGINASTHNEAGATWSDNFHFGNFVARMGWQTCASVNEPWASMDTMNVRHLVPVGERAADNRNSWRWSGEAAEQYGAIVDQMGTLPLGDPQLDDLFVQAMEIWLDELPVIPITQAKKIIPFNNTYWTGWPTAENAYIHPPTWWQGNTLKIILGLQPN
ncbi:MAG TPA: ABC transporter substrate-binding protein [Anaerolineales bacterium]|nr:ABC transporter substrate-binding protein [Anaerolineales bacterium]